MVSRSACPGGHQNTGRIFIAPKSIQIWFIIRFEPPPKFFKNYKAKCKHSMTLQICSSCCWALGCHLQNVQQKKTATYGSCPTHWAIQWRIKFAFVCQPHSRHSFPFSSETTHPTSIWSRNGFSQRHPKTNYNHKHSQTRKKPITT